ncbi:MAG TPA: hypothetical protein VLN61_10550 [Pseudolabrys sp.]|nr:hypothetical protein [Pseudolabrys sp.]
MSMEFHPFFVVFTGRNCDERPAIVVAILRRVAVFQQAGLWVTLTRTPRLRMIAATSWSRVTAKFREDFHETKNDYVDGLDLQQCADQLKRR